MKQSLASFEVISTKLIEKPKSEYETRSSEEEAIDQISRDIE